MGTIRRNRPPSPMVLSSYRRLGFATLGALIPGLGHAVQGRWRAALLLQLLLLASIAALCLSRLIVTDHGLALLAATAGAVHLLSAISCTAGTTLPSSLGRQWAHGWLFALASTALALGLFMAKGPLLGVNLYYVPSPSMLPTLQVGDLILVDLWAYRRQNPVPGDVVTLRMRENRNLVLVKRIAKTRSRASELQYFVTGDNPAQSRDSRYFGWIYGDEIEGRLAHILPLAALTNQVTQPPPSASN